MLDITTPVTVRSVEVSDVFLCIMLIMLVWYGGSYKKNILDLITGPSFINKNIFFSLSRRRVDFPLTWSFPVLWDNRSRTADCLLVCRSMPLSWYRNNGRYFSHDFFQLRAIFLCHLHYRWWDIECRCTHFICRYTSLTSLR